MANEYIDTRHSITGYKYYTSFKRSSLKLKSAKVLQVHFTCKTQTFPLQQCMYSYDLNSNTLWMQKE